MMKSRKKATDGRGHRGWISPYRSAFWALYERYGSSTPRVRTYVTPPATLPLVPIYSLRTEDEGAVLQSFDERSYW